MPKNAKSKPSKDREFQTYIVWRSLPSFLIGKPKKLLAKFGITDPVAKEVLSIKTQSEFAKKYDIKDLGTLTDWNKRIEKDNLLIQVSRRWTMERLPDLVEALYQRILKTGDAKEARLWAEFIEGWRPRQDEEKSKQKLNKKKILYLQQKVNQLTFKNAQLEEQLKNIKGH